MGKYSIKELEKLSGIKAHTLRIWEKRHKLIDPDRTTTNIRLYSDDDLRKIINVSVLNNYGIKISKIAHMSVDEMNTKVREISEIRNDSAIHIDQLVLAMIDLEEESFEKILNTLILRYGFEKTMTEIVYPFLQKIGILWQTENITPAHEHFITNLIRQKILVALDALPLPPKTATRLMLFLPEGELHELGLLFYHYSLRKKGYRTYYLGQNVPHADVRLVYATHKPSILVTHITASLPLPIDQYLNKLAEDFPEAEIYISGYQVINYKGIKLKNIQTFFTVQDLNQLL